MLNTVRSYGGMVVAPHHLAARAGLGVLEDGGNAVEAMVAAAAAIAVCYPHMNSLGGDCFWLICAPGAAPLGIEACGPAAAGASIELYAQLGHDAIPDRGPLAALTVAGAPAGWALALEHSAAAFGGRLPLGRLLEDAARHAREGIATTASQAADTAAKLEELEGVPGFADHFLIEGRVPSAGARFRNAALAATLEALARAGLDDFYRGDVARALGADLEAAGSPLRLADLEAFRARFVAPLSVTIGRHRAYNLPPPTQGFASLMILGMLPHLELGAPDSFAFVHAILEATKQAFLVRDAHLTDPDHMTLDPAEFLTPDALASRARAIDPAAALPWPQPAAPGDTVWLGAIDAQGRAVSFIQSTYWEFGSGLTLPQTGIVGQNRGTSFSLARGHLNHLVPGRRPLHTIQPPLARLTPDAPHGRPYLLYSTGLDRNDDGGDFDLADSLRCVEDPNARTDYTVNQPRRPMAEYWDEFR